MARRNRVRVAPDLPDVPPPPPAMSPDVRDTITLLRWARQNGFRIERFAVGSVTMEVVDLRLRKREGIDRDMPMDRGPLADVGVFLPTDDEPVEGTVG